MAAGLGHVPDVGAYLSGAISPHTASQAVITDEGDTMFTTDSFMNAEVTYREGRVRRGLTTRRELAAAKRSAKTSDPR